PRAGGIRRRAWFPPGRAARLRRTRPRPGRGGRTCPRGRRRAPARAQPVPAPRAAGCPGTDAPRVRRADVGSAGATTRAGGCPRPSGGAPRRRTADAAARSAGVVPRRSGPRGGGLRGRRAWRSRLTVARVRGDGEPSTPRDEDELVAARRCDVEQGRGRDGRTSFEARHGGPRRRRATSELVLRQHGNLPGAAY